MSYMVTNPKERLSCEVPQIKYNLCKDLGKVRNQDNVQA